MKRQIIVVAGGKGLRMGTELPKQFLPIAGRPVLMHTLERFHAYDPQMEIILVLPRAQQEYWKEQCAQYVFYVPFLLADGGDTRFHSVLNGLSMACREGLIGIHDGVRPFVSTEVIDRCFREAEQSGTAIPVLPLVDSLRHLLPSGGSEVADRAAYCLVQTPQVFHAELLHKAYRQPCSDAFTDDASVVESLGHSVALVEGNRENLKITTPFDLEVAELLARDERFAPNV